MTDKSEIKIWQNACYERDRGVCQVLGGSADLNNCHHIIRRKYREFRYDVDNGFSASFDGHRWIEENPELSIKLIITSIGPERFNRLRNKFKETYGFDYFANKVSDNYNLKSIK